jgi:hypothetical protein
VISDFIHGNKRPLWEHPICMSGSLMTPRQEVPEAMFVSGWLVFECLRCYKLASGS